MSTPEGDTAHEPSDGPSAPRERPIYANALHQGLRERKKALMRQLISDTATLMFLERGFDEVRVSEVAAACDVSEKTIYNYFPTKESLLLDREDDQAKALRAALGPDGEGGSPVEAMVRVLTSELEEFVTHIDATDDELFPQIVDFNDLIESTPSLKAARADVIERLAQVAAEAMAERAGVDPSDPEPQIAADALTSLWRIQYRAIVKYASEGLSAEEVRDAAISDVRRAARLIDTGLWSFATVVQGASGRAEFNAAADASVEARKQVLAAMKQARSAWLALRTEMEKHAHDTPDSGRRTFKEIQLAHQDAHHRAHQEAFEFRRDIRQRNQGRRELTQRRKDEARRLGEELKKELRDEARQRGQAIRDAAKRGKRSGPS